MGIFVGDCSQLSNCSFLFNGFNNQVIIGDNVNIQNVTFWFEDNNNKIIIGNYTTMGGKAMLIACEGRTIEIGADCMFSHDIIVRTTDSHPIIDKDGCRINLAEDVSLVIMFGLVCKPLFLRAHERGIM